ncbi:hypothetical protein COLO4_34323 [Corchorus olitorius]|uniref:Uncharacterized protein n=1 Tax=Corchorus olitorius TaxID=93759 RepID=A0A1R3GLS8_9ROSI|nr:hypothetical protein COLO4_34323 [Corchorus olitorius]
MSRLMRLPIVKLFMKSDNGLFLCSTEISMLKTGTHIVHPSKPTTLTRSPSS